MWLSTYFGDTLGFDFEIPEGWEMFDPICLKSIVKNVSLHQFLFQILLILAKFLVCITTAIEQK